MRCHALDQSSELFHAYCTAKDSGDLSTAQKLLQPLIRHADQMVSKDPSLLEFEERFQEKLYLMRYEAAQPLATSASTCGTFYEHYGQLLMQLGELTEARQTLAKAKRIRPAVARIDLTLAEIAWRNGDSDAFMKHTQTAFAIAYRPEDVAQCHEHFARLQLMAHQPEMALACIEMSLCFQGSAERFRLRNTLRQQLNRQGAYTLHELTDLCHAHNLPLMIDDSITSLALMLESIYKNDPDPSYYHYYHRIYTRLAGRPA